MVHPADALEYRNRQYARIVTLLSALLLLLLCLFLVIDESTIPPPDELAYEVQGSIDFGNNTMGSRKVNNFQPPSPTPSDAPKTEVKPVVQKAAPQPEPIITKTAPAEIKAHKAEPTSQPVKDAAPQPTAQPTTQPAAQAKPKPQADPNALFSPGGSNDGDGGDVGNKGSPKSASLGSGMGWGDGSGSGGDGGLGRRTFIGGPMPKYNAQEEGKFVIEISIRPDGSVQNVRILKGYAGQINIKKAVEEAIYRWKFSPVGNSQTQKVKVTYTFKLR